MKNPPWDWQSRICLDIITRISVGETFTGQTCRHLLKHDIHPAEMFPLQRNIPDAITSYLQILVFCGLISQEAEDIYRKLRPVVCYKTIEEALADDDRIMYDLDKYGRKYL